MPLDMHEVDASVPFENEELLYRRVSANELNQLGEITPDQFNSISFASNVQSAPSVLRARFAEPKDTLASECAGGKDVSAWQVFGIKAGQLPKAMASGDNRSFDFYPLHHPLAGCGAHSVIASCVSGDSSLSYICPPRSVRNALRAKLAAMFKSVEIVQGSGEH